jgi:glycosyltransferase involved in cell wall biosynthesis
MAPGCGLLPPGSPLSMRMKEIGVPGYGIRFSNLSFLNPFKVWMLARIFRKEQVGSLVTNLSGDMKVASIAGKLAGVSRIIYRRGSAIPIRNNPLNRYLLRRVITKIIANSQETKRTILANNESLVPEDKIRVIYNGVNLPNYHPEVQALYAPVNGRELILGCAGRLSEEKGHLHLLEMMQILERTEHPFRLLIAGEGRMLHVLQKRAKKLGVEDRVDFLGFVEDMPAFFRSLDIFLLSSHYEGFGYVIAEAMASRVPVIAFDIKSSAEIIEHGQTGYITRQNNAGEMAQKVVELAGNPDLRKEMGLKGRKRVESLFSFEKIQEEIRDLLSCTNGY